MPKLFSLRTLLLTVLFLILGVPAGRTQPAQSERIDPLDLANGAVILSKSSQYGVAQWSALALLDGTPNIGWCSDTGAPFPHEFLIELARPIALESLVFDNTQNQESQYSGISAKDVEVYASNTSATEGLTKVLQVQLPKGARQEVKLPAPTPARWLKLVILSNWGNSTYTELMELEAFGQSLPGAVVQAPLSGTYKTNYGLIQFDQAGNAVKGCYYEGQGTFNGTTDGRVVQCEWRQDQGKRFGTALMVLSAKGDFIDGFWYENGNLAGTWFGERAKPGEDAKCQVDLKSSAISAELAQTGRAITYGILFNTASDQIKPESEPTLNEVLQLLKSQPTLNLTIEGHTDAQGSDSYNQDLSQRRAQSVVAWLTSHGVEAGRLTAAGFGKTHPVSDNATPQGRTLNRRVELAKK
jgi:outer membrane protein OmpA-like peptidoglycan-associated protein